MSRFYDDLSSWYRMLDPPEDHAEEAELVLDGLRRAVTGPCVELLELGAGAGHNALHLKAALRCTLSDLSAPMLALSRALNPECEHVQADMRTLRLGRQFDAVLIHDAIAYMTELDDLRAALTTAWVHTRPGGAALFAPDCVADSFVEACEVHEADDGERSLRCLEWAWTPGVDTQRYRVSYAALLRERGVITAFHEESEEGLFSRETWLGLLREVGFEPELLARPLAEPGRYTETIFLARRPA